MDRLDILHEKKSPSFTFDTGQTLLLLEIQKKGCIASKHLAFLLLLHFSHIFSRQKWNFRNFFCHFEQAIVIGRECNPIINEINQLAISSQN